MYIHYGRVGHDHLHYFVLYMLRQRCFEQFAYYGQGYVDSYLHDEQAHYHAYHRVEHTPRIAQEDSPSYAYGRRYR